MTPADRPSQRDQLVAEHAEIDRALDGLVDAFRLGDRDVARDAFRAFDAQLSAHLAHEEDLLLPEFAKIDPDEAAQIVHEHALLRAAIDELAIGTDLHLTRVPAIRNLADLLRAHARREDVLYREVETRTRPHPSEHDLSEPPASQDMS
ncbi:MAG: hemerythrin domain-containing protein [Proteobacteria bacterium]|nr:hemerythrin domain-containing protein [Pseudomonadota bacterium]